MEEFYLVYTLTSSYHTIHAMHLKSEFNWKLKSLLTFSLPVFKHKIDHPRQILKSLPTAASGRFDYLTKCYTTHLWRSLCSESEFQENMYVLDILNRYMPHIEIRGRSLDIGSSKWGYLPALCSYTHTPWDGIEIDPNQRYITFDTRRAHAEYMVRAYPDSRYISGSLLKLSGCYPLITWFLPYISEESFHASQLPERYFQPDTLLSHALKLLAPRGRIIIINQGKTERDLQQAIFEKLGVTVEALGKIESPFSPYKKERYGWLVEK